MPTMEVKKLRAMKNLIISFVIALMVLPLIAQQSIKLSAFEQQRLNFQDTDYYHNSDVTLRGSEMKSIKSNLPNTSVNIKMDSVIILREQGEYCSKYSYNANGMLIAKLRMTLISGSWMNQMLNSYTYDEFGNLITEVEYMWQGNEWKDKSIVTSTYDLHGNQLTSLHQYVHLNGLMNVSQIAMTYDSFGKQLTKKYQWWIDEEWQYESSIINTYNELNKLATAHYQFWHDGGWLDDRMDIYTYDSTGNPLSLMSMSWIFTEWMKTWQYVYTVDENGNLVSQLIQDWDNLNGGWINQSLSEHTFDENGNWLTNVMQLWVDEAWQNNISYTRVFDLENNLTERMSQFWEGNTWCNSTRVSVDFSTGLAIAQAYKWDGNSWIVSTYSEWLTIFMDGEYIYSDDGINMKFYFTDVTGIEEQNAPLVNETIHYYPNPATDQINIKINPAWQADRFQIELFGQTGQRVKPIEISYSENSFEISLDVGNVPPGLYLLRVTAGQFASTQKVIISR